MDSIQIHFNMQLYSVNISFGVVQTGRASFYYLYQWLAGIPSIRPRDCGELFRLLLSGHSLLLEGEWFLWLRENKRNLLSPTGKIKQLLVNS